MPPKTVAGIIQITRKGVGYLAWPMDEQKTADAKARGSKVEKEKEDIEISIENLGGALNGDQVEVELAGLAPVRGFKPKPKPGAPATAGSRYAGKVVVVVERAKTEFVCTLKHENEPARPNGGWVATADDARVYKPFHIKTIPEGTKEGTKVLVRLISFFEQPEGEIIETIGMAGEHRTEMNAIVLEHGFKTSFPPEVEREAHEIERNHAHMIGGEISKRADLRHLTAMTIDPVSAKDFDDALSIRALPGGEFEVGVHIADATFFCRPGTALDDEAQKRGTSVYLVDATIPMLPHALSGNVCSLMPGQDRLAFSALFRMNAAGSVLERTFTKSVINSKKRFSYEEAQEVLDTGHGPFLSELNDMRMLATAMRKRRSDDGAVDFGDNEVEFELDATGVPLKVTRKVRIDTNWLIEEFMLLCNREVSEYVSKLAEKVPEAGMVFLYRIHDEPKMDRIDELGTFVRAIGYEFDKKKGKYSARDIANLLEQIKGKPEEHLIRTATLRSMAKAMYSTKNIGHFGLSFKYYTQFTSPIRRYPDMLAHRILESHLNGKPITRREYVDLEKRCLLASEQEAKATTADRESIKYKLVEYMMSKIGQTFEGVISGVTDWGLYVEEKESSAEGLVRVRALGDDFYNYSQKEYSLVGQRTKKKYTLGDAVKIKLVAADLGARQLDFELVK